MCSLLCLWLNSNDNKITQATSELRAKEGEGEPSTGVTVLNVVVRFFYDVMFISDSFVTCVLLLEQACTVTVFQF